MLIIFGLTVLVASVLGGYAAMGGNLAVLVQPFEFLIIMGAAVGIYLLANPWYVVTDTLRTIGKLFKGKPHTQDDYLELLSMMYLVFRQGRADINQLENDLDNPAESSFFNRFPRVAKNPKTLRFFCDYMRVILLHQQVKPHEVEALIDEELETIRIELKKVPHALSVMADGLPALGIVACVLGVIKAMGAIDESPAVLGYYIGGALTGTFLGVILSYGLVGPIAQLVKGRREEEMNYYIAMKSGLMAFLNGADQQISIEFARKVLNSGVRPTMQEVDEAVYVHKMAMTTNRID